MEKFNRFCLLYFELKWDRLKNTKEFYQFEYANSTLERKQRSFSRILTEKMAFYFSKGF